MSDYYILNAQGEPVACDSVHEWGRMFERGNRVVAKEQIGDANISTVFLGLDHSFEEGAAPVLWETMVFGGKLNEEQDRCSGGREQAEAMHARMVQRVKEATP